MLKVGQQKRLMWIKRTMSAPAILCHTRPPAKAVGQPTHGRSNEKERNRRQAIEEKEKRKIEREQKKKQREEQLKLKAEEKARKVAEKAAEKGKKAFERERAKHDKQSKASAPKSASAK